MDCCLSMYLLGDVRVRRSDQPVHLSPHEIAVLVYLAIESDRPAPRPVVAELVWGRTMSNRGKASLSQVVYTLKSKLPPSCLIISRTHLCCDLNTVWVDYRSVISLIRESRIIDVVPLYQADFLSELPYISDQFDDWRIAKSAFLSRQVVNACRRAIDEKLESEEYETVSEICSLAMRVPEHRDEFLAIRIEALAMSGRVDEASFELNERLARSDAPTSLLNLHDSIRKISPPDDCIVGAALSLPMVGRDSETKQLIRAWDESKIGCRVVALMGEAGIGKTRLLQQTMKRYILRGATSYLHQCMESEKHLVYAGLAGILQQKAGHVDIRQLAEPWARSLLDIAPEAFVTTEPVSASHLSRHRIVREAFAQYLLLLGKTAPVVIAIDDFQWLDEPTREVLIYVTKRLPDHPLLLVVAGRPPLKPITYEDDTNLSTSLSLRRLEDESIAALLNAFCERHSVSIAPETRRTLVSYTSGKPLLLIEVLRQIATDPGSKDNLVLPATIKSLVENQIKGLTQEAQVLLWASGTLSHDADLDFLAKMTGLLPLQAASAAQKLIASGLLAGSHRLLFRHDLIRQAVRECIPPYERGMWHGQAAEAYASQLPDATHLIAMHFERAGRFREAFKFSKRAAVSASGRHAVQEQEEHIQRMLRCSRGMNRSVGLKMLLTLWASLGQYKKLQPYALEISSLPLDSAQEVLSAMVRFHSEQDDSDLAGLVARAKKIINMTKQRAPELLTTVLWQVADHIRRSDEKKLMSEYATLLQGMSQEASLEDSVDMLALAALLAGSSEGYVRAVPIADLAFALAESSGSGMAMAKARFARGTSRLWAGCITAADEDYHEAVRLAESLGLETVLHVATANLAVVLMEQARFEEAKVFALRALQDVGHSRRAYSYGNLALIASKQGSFDQVRHYANAMLECHKLSPQPWIPNHVEAFLGSACLASGDYAQAYIYAKSVQANPGCYGELADNSHIHIFCAEACAAFEGDPAVASSLHKAAEKTITRDYIGGARMLLKAGEIARLFGQRTIPDSRIGGILDQARGAGAVLLRDEAAALL